MSAKVREKRTGPAQAETPVRAPLTGGRQALLGLVGLGLALTLFSSYAYRMENPSLTVQNKKHGGEQGGQGGMGQGGAMGGMGSMGQVRELMAKVEQDPNDVHSLVDLADIFMTMGAVDRASKYLDQAQALQPGDMEIMQRRGLAQFQLERHEEAAKTFEAVLAKEPNNALAHFNLGIVNRYFLKNEAAAAEHFAKAAALPTDDAELAAKAKEEAAKQGP